MILKTIGFLPLYRSQIIDLFDQEATGVKTIYEYVDRIESLSVEMTTNLTIEKTKFLMLAAETQETDAAKQALISYETPRIKDRVQDQVNKFKGDITELLAECFFACNRASPRVGLDDYAIVPLAEDYGVDGTGMNATGRKSVVQVKYRANPTELIDLGSLAKTYLCGVNDHGIDPYDADTVWLFTTCAGATDPALKQLKKRLRVIDKKIISGEIDNNVSFWKFVQDSLIESFKQLDGR